MTERASLGEVIAWVKHHANPMDRATVIEIQALLEMEYFGQAWTPALREQGLADPYPAGANASCWTVSRVCLQRQLGAAVAPNITQLRLKWPRILRPTAIH